MFHVIRNWFKLHFSDPESSVLILLLIFGFLVIWLTGGFTCTRAGRLGYYLFT